MSKATEDKHQADDLLHCPFCGSDDLIRFRLHDTERIECQNCWGAGPTHEVTQKWNTRSQSADDSRPASCSGQRIHKLECALREIETWARNSDLFPTNREALERIARHAVTAIKSKPNAEVRPPETKP